MNKAEYFAADIERLGVPTTLNWDDTHLLEYAQKFGIARTDWHGARCILRFVDDSKVSWIYDHNGPRVIVPSAYFDEKAVYVFRPASQALPNMACQAVYQSCGLGYWLADCPFGKWGEPVVMNKRHDWENLREFKDESVQNILAHLGRFRSAGSHEVHFSGLATDDDTTTLGDLVEIATALEQPIL